MKIRIAIIAATGSAYKRTIPALKNSAICEVVAIQARNLDKLKSICSEYAIPSYFIDEKMMLTKAMYDLIYIANPPFMHFDSIKTAVATGKPIICEKPLDKDYHSALRYRELLSNYDSPFMVAHHLRHQQLFLDIKNAIDSGKIGQIQSVFCQWGFKMNTNATNAAWKLDPSLSGGGTFSDNGIHIVDFILGLLSKPKSVFGHSFSTSDSFEHVFDTETATLVYPKTTVTLNSSQNMEFPGNH
ncbi:MAG: Gfo/Idh/MocA family oxidoreductase, partial [Clostridiales bacterium]|nr:Gfo/Idh/MocA family oxidoreductase [Clostridiales bacterium]